MAEITQNDMDEAYQAVGGANATCKYAAEMLAERLPVLEEQQGAIVTPRGIEAHYWCEERDGDHTIYDLALGRCNNVLPEDRQADGPVIIPPDDPRHDYYVHGGF